jgi:hypothetical protein
MNVIKFELLKLRSKSRGWLGPILVFILILVAFPLTLFKQRFRTIIFFSFVDCNASCNDAGYRRYFF